MLLSDTERAFLEAAAELTLRQQELEPLVSATLGRSAFDYWIRWQGRGDPKLDCLDLTENGEWRFHFHGLEFDLLHVSDGRTVRVDFGPGGSLTFTPGGVGSFVARTRPPWRTFPELMRFLAGPVSYDHARCAQLTESLMAKGYIAMAAPEFVALMAKHTTFIPGRGHLVDVPPQARPEDETFLLLPHNLVLTDKARQLLAGTAG